MTEWLIASATTRLAREDADDQQKHDIQKGAEKKRDVQHENSWHDPLANPCNAAVDARDQIQDKQEQEHAKNRLPDKQHGTGAYTRLRTDAEQQVEHKKAKRRRPFPGKDHTDNHLE